VSGDFYWIEALDDKLYFAVADCTGHGVPGAMVSMVCYNALNRSVLEYKLESPAEILAKVRDLIKSTFQEKKADVNDGMDISLCCFDRKSKILQFAGAYNPLYYIRNNELIEIKGDKQPVGRHILEEPFTNHSIELLEGDQVYLFSDGYADQFGGENEKKFKYKPFKEVLLKNHPKPHKNQEEILRKTFEQWKGDIEQIDDVCILGVKI